MPIRPQLFTMVRRYAAAAEQGDKVMRVLSAARTFLCFYLMDYPF